MLHSRIAAAVMALMVAGAGSAVAADAKVATGKLVKFDYTLSVDGKMLETSEGKEPAAALVGARQIIPGLETAMVGMKVGETKDVTVAPKDAYGEPSPKGIMDFPVSSLPKGAEPKVGMTLQANAPDGSQFPAVIKEVNGDKVKIDLNHPLAGKTLQFKVKVVSIEDAPTPAPGK